MTYGGSVPALAASITGFVNSDPATVVSGTAPCTTTATSLTSVGSYPTECQAHTTLAATNYTLQYVTGLVTVGQATLTVTAPSAPMTYGGSVPALAASITGLVNSDPATVVSGTAPCTTTATSLTSVGSYPTECQAHTTLAATNYTFQYVTGLVTVGQATLTVTAPSAPMTYGGSVPALAASITGFVNSDPATVVSGTAPCTTTATSLTSVGSYPTECQAHTTLAATNYTFQYVTGLVTVGQATLTVTAPSAPMTYGGSVPALAASITGFVNSDPATVVSGTAPCTTTATSLTS